MGNGSFTSTFIPVDSLDGRAVTGGVVSSAPFVAVETLDLRLGIVMMVERQGLWVVAQEGKK